MSNKLLITGILGFVMPGTAAQIVAGNVLAFCVLIGYLWFRPYREKAVFLVGFSAALVLSIFFYVALLIKTQVSYRCSCDSCEMGVNRASTYCKLSNVTQVTVFPNHDDIFYGAVVGILMCAVFVVPAIVIAHQLRWRLYQKDDNNLGGAAADPDRDPDNSLSRQSSGGESSSAGDLSMFEEAEDEADANVGANVAAEAVDVDGGGEDGEAVAGFAAAVHAAMAAAARSMPHSALRGPREKNGESERSAKVMWAGAVRAANRASQPSRVLFLPQPQDDAESDS